MKVYIIEWYDGFGEGSSWIGKVFTTREKAEIDASKERESMIIAETSRGIPTEEAEYYADKFYISEKEVME